MAVRINADTVTGGAVVTADATGIMELQSGGSTKLTLNSSGVTLASALPIASGGTGTTSTATAGGAVYGTGTAYAITAAGTAGQVLTSAGSSAPTWTTPAGGSWTYLSTVTASAAATADVETTFNSTYDMYAITAVNVLMSASATRLECFMKIGGTYLTSAYSWIALRATSDVPSSTPTGSSNDTFIYIANGLSNTAGQTTAFTMYIPAPSSTSAGKTVYANGVGRNSSTITSSISMAGSNSGTGALTGIRFSGLSGNISGTFRLYGIKNS